MCETGRRILWSYSALLKTGFLFIANGDLKIEILIKLFKHPDCAAPHNSHHTTHTSQPAAAQSSFCVRDHVFFFVEAVTILCKIFAQVCAFIIHIRFLKNSPFAHSCLCCASLNNLWIYHKRAFLWTYVAHKSKTNMYEQTISTNKKFINCLKCRSNCIPVLSNPTDIRIYIYFII